MIEFHKLRRIARIPRAHKTETNVLHIVILSSFVV